MVRNKNKDFSTEENPQLPTVKRLFKVKRVYGARYDQRIFLKESEDIPFDEFMQVKLKPPLTVSNTQTHKQVRNYGAQPNCDNAEVSLLNHRETSDLSQQPTKGSLQSASGVELSARGGNSLESVTKHQEAVGLTIGGTEMRSTNQSSGAAAAK